MNGLAREKSPYLLQHRNNPVNWYPWCAEAFDKARQEDKPILLSIGYSTCHWCHVMAHESFEDEETARILNEYFICIKVDREERPDIDAVYMKACQELSGSGGWPMTVFMTPEQRPFFAATYLPRRSRYGSPGLIETALEIARRWRSDRRALLQAGDTVTAAIANRDPLPGEPNETLLRAAYESLRHRFDETWGGFGSAPKFPAPHNLLFLMQYGDTDMAATTLSAMAKGGIFDQVGGGFSRYSTDAIWLIPHYEKTLYDNALLILALCEAYERTHDPLFSDIAQRTADYLLTELRAPEGGLYSGQDADSEGVEGRYYTFSPDEIRSVLGEREGEAFCRDYGITDGVSLPNRIRSGAQPWDPARLRPLLRYRRARTLLHTDDKILLSWNAWAILALVRSGHLRDALAIHDFIEANMVDADERLYLRCCSGEAACDGQLDDYAVYALALLALYQATFDVQYLERAIFRAEQMLDFFEDEAGGYYLTAHDAEVLIHRPKETWDGALPSGNSVAAMVLEKLAQLTGETSWRAAADRQMRYMAGHAAEYPAGYTFALLAMDRALHPGSTLVVCGQTLPDEMQELREGGRNLLFKSPANAERLTVCAPFTAAYPVPEHGVCGYLCEYGACRRAGSDLSALLCSG